MKAKIYSWKEFDEEGFIDVSLDHDALYMIINEYKNRIDEEIYHGHYEEARELIDEYIELNDKLSVKIEGELISDN